MTVWYAIIAAALGFAAVYFSHFAPPAQYTAYLAVATVAAVDALVGGLRAHLEVCFQPQAFLAGFLLNTAAAIGLTWLGVQLGVDLTLAVMVAFALRVFANLSRIRNVMLGRWSAQTADS